MRNQVAGWVTEVVIGMTAVVAMGELPGVAQTAAPTVELRKAIADQLLDEGMQYHQTSQFEAAIQSWQQALMLYRQINDRQGEGQALGNLGGTYQSIGNYPKAIELHQQSLAIAREVNNRRGQGATLGNLGIVYDLLGNYAKAIEHHEQHLAIAREIKDQLAVGNALGNLGNAYLSLGNYPKAIEYQEQSLQIAREIDDRPGEGQTLSSLGIAYLSLGNYAKAIQYHEQSLAIAQETRDRLAEGQALGNLGSTYYSLGNHAKAIEYQERRLVIVRAIRDRQGEGQTLGNLGSAHYSLGNYAKAIEYQNQSLAIAREIKNRLGEGKSLGNLGNVYNDLGHTAKAIEYYESSLAIAREIKDRQGEGQALGSLGLAYNALGNYAKAIEYYEQRLAIAQEIKDREGERLALNNLGFALTKQEPELTIVFYKQSVNVAESIRKDLRKLPREAQEIYTSTVAGTYRRLADLLLTQGRTREAQAILELLKVQESSNYDEQQQTSPIQFPLHSLETQIWQQIEQQKTFSLATLEPLGKTLKQQTDRITQAMNQSNLAIGNPNIILNTQPNTLLIQNLVVGDKLWVIWTNAKGTVKTISLDLPQTELTQTVDRLRKALGSPYSNLDSLKATSHTLYNWLIPPPLQTELSQNPNLKLLFSLDHVTRYIPIATLYDGQQYLIQKHTLSNLITTDTDMGDRFAPHGQTPTILALGTSHGFPGFNPLPNVEAELHAIVRQNSDRGNRGNDRGIYPGIIQLNAAFTANSLRTPAPSRVLHIATHGSFNPKTITASFLLLGNGDKLPITDIANLTNLSTKHLVVLSACETGISSASSDGTEISGISNYFLRRGAKSVLASLWAVNDASTALLMQQFYQHLANGHTKAQALQQVQQAFITEQFSLTDARALPRANARPDVPGQPAPNSLAHPYYWAPFTLVGNSL